MSEMIEKIGTKKLITIGLVIVGIVVVVIICSLIYNKFFYKKSYSEIESIMTEAAKEYYSDNESELPSGNGESTSVDADTLVSKDYMNSIADYLKDDDTSCTGTVNVTKNNDDYRYVPLLICGDDYTVSTLTNYIEDNVDIVSSGDGLYEMNNEYIYRGEYVDNYVTFGDYSWRIVKISDGKVVLIFNDRWEDSETVVWDNRYNSSRDDSTGINDYSVSRIRDSLEEVYESDILFSDDDKLLLSTFDLYVGKRGENETDNSGLIEKGTIIEDQYIGLLPVYDLLNASLDSNCSSTLDASCRNYNYLTTYSRSWWTITADSGNTYKSYKVSNSSGLSLTRTNTKAYIRPIVYLVSDALYVSGDGTEENPYTFK